MFDGDMPVLALAQGRVCKAMEIVARQHMLIVRLEMSGRSSAHQVDLLRRFEEDLAVFEQHLAFLREPPLVPAPPRR